MSDSKTSNPSHELGLAYFRKADNDLQAARSILAGERVPHDAVCFHCQQLAEKYLKGFLAWHAARFERTHDLEMLIEQCTAIASALEDLVTSADLLTQYAVRVRYPDFPDEPTIEDSMQALAAALTIRDRVRVELALPVDEM